MRKNEFKNLRKADGGSRVVYKNYRFLLTATMEELNMDTNCYGAVLKYGNKAILAGMNYKGETLAAIYESRSGHLDIESEIELIEIADQTFEDNGHAVAWAIAEMN